MNPKNILVLYIDQAVKGAPLVLKVEELDNFRDHYPRTEVDTSKVHDGGPGYNVGIDLHTTSPILGVYDATSQLSMTNLAGRAQRFGELVALGPTVLALDRLLNPRSAQQVEG